MLKVLMLRSELSAKQSELRKLQDVSEGFKSREAELAKDIEEAATEEQRGVVKTAIETFEAERSANTKDIECVQGDISAMEASIAELENQQRATEKTPGNAEQKRTDLNMADFETTELRTSFFGMTITQRDAFMARDEVKEFLTRVRELGVQKRAVSGAELGIPTVALDILRSNIDKYSKLMNYVKRKVVKGKARQPIAGVVPEAVWTESVANLNELEIVFSEVEVDGYKLGGYIAIANSMIEDNDDIALLQELLDSMGIAIGKGVDRAIVYGTGTKMPVGFVTRLAATSQPGWWGSNQGAFTDLHTTNIKKLDIGTSTGVAFFQPFIEALGIADPEYSVSGEAVWIMNRKTHMDILSRALAFDAAATLVAGIKTTMPVIGGEVIDLSFMADYDVAGGFLDEYLLVERSGANIRASDIPMMIQDQTLVCATQRFDGKPCYGEGFVLVNYKNADASSTKTFDTDYANSEIGILGVTNVASETTSGATVVTVTGATSGAQLLYKIAGKPLQIYNGFKIGDTWTEFDSGDEITCEAGAYINVVEIDANDRAVKLGSAVAVPMV